MRSILQIASAVLSGAISLATAQGAILSVTDSGSGTVPLVQSSFGLLQTALNFGGATTTNNGITFTGTTVSGDPPSATVASSPFDVMISTTTTLRNDATIAPDELFGSEIWSSSQAPISMTVSGLNPAATYQFQYLYGEARGQVYAGGNVVFTDSTGDTDNLTLSFGNSGNNYVIVAVEVTGTTSLTSEMPRAIRGPSYSGLAIFAVPEPSLTLAGAAGLFALLFSALKWGRWDSNPGPTD